MNALDEARVREVAREAADEEIREMFDRLDLINERGDPDYGALAAPAKWMRKCERWRERITLTALSTAAGAFIIALWQAAPDIWAALRARLWP